MTMTTIFFLHGGVIGQAAPCHGAKRTFPACVLARNDRSKQPRPLLPISCSVVQGEGVGRSINWEKPTPTDTPGALFSTQDFLQRSSVENCNLLIGSIPPSGFSPFSGGGWVYIKTGSILCIPSYTLSRYRCPPAVSHAMLLYRSLAQERNSAHSRPVPGTF